MTISQLKAVKRLEKDTLQESNFLLEALPSTQLNSFNSLAQVDNLPCVRYLQGHLI